MLFLAVGNETILDVIRIEGSDKYSRNRLEPPEFFDEEMSDRALKIFKSKYPLAHDFNIREKCGDEYVIEAMSPIKDVVDAIDKDQASRLFRGMHPTMLNTKSAVTVYAIQEWQGITI